MLVAAFNLYIRRHGGPGPTTELLLSLERAVTDSAVGEELAELRQRVAEDDERWDKLTLIRVDSSESATKVAASWRDAGGDIGELARAVLRLAARVDDLDV